MVSCTRAVFAALMAVDPLSGEPVPHLGSLWADGDTDSYTLKYASAAICIVMLVALDPLCGATGVC